MHNFFSLSKPCKIHFIGIGGISMSGLAEILKNHGFDVCGSDNASTEITKRLMGLGINVCIPNAAKNIPEDVDAVVFTAAVKKDNPEYTHAISKGLPTLERAELIRFLLESYENTICIAGTHGKTTTTGMIADTLTFCGLDPTVSVGGHMASTGLNYRIGGKTTFVLEACEYNNSFLHWQPKIGVILNIEDDHPDFYSGLEDIINSFKKFAQNIKPGGCLIINSSLPCFESITKSLNVEVVSFGPENSAARFTPKNIQQKKGKTIFDVMDWQNVAAQVHLPFYGEYNILNALACFAVSHVLGINHEKIADGLAAAKGMKRRFEIKGTVKGITIIDDYAHLPSEIKACLKALREMVEPKAKIVCLFQPHTYSRTKYFLSEFAASFYGADEVLLLPIFSARESFDPEISSDMLKNKIAENGTCAKMFEKFDETGNYLANHLKEGDVLMTLGAGEAYKVGDSLLRGEFSTLSTCY